MEFHELANIFPMMNTDEYQKLKADISTSGFDSSLPIILYENKILDGRNRYKACEELGIKPAYTTFNNGDPLSYVVRTNLHRRHLQPGQLAFVALDIEKHFAEKAKENQGKRTDIEKPANLFQRIEKSKEELKPIHAAKEAAKQIGVNAQYVSDAKKIQNVAPELAEKIIAGKMTIPEAKRVINRAERIEKLVEITENNKPLEGIGIFPVIYADPPWQYEHPISDSRRIENQYPTMTIEDICNLPVNDIATDDAVIFLWATTPMLKKGFQVLDAWGFEYRTCMVWVKPSIGPGHWVRNRHELLLIGVKGNIPTPKGEDKPDSVIEAPRQEHSKKPEIVYDIIEKMYPELEKVELFCRQPRQGWKAWGNQS
jgi:N6-adenosine-specific RNA methylase IME4/ParB-like chromosome segregation protein Spo0J